ncbi:MAG: penicillin-binding transpeptidase domain-containing protein [Clostridia bacterium]|nr:penicillin-binding transpeptidase domain-containing protein [Clostridia bacterium]
MRTVGRRSLTLYILLACFIAGMAFFLFKYLKDGSTWVTYAYNGHIYAEDATAVAGNIYDRDGSLLATTINGERIYSDNETTRRALLHTVGDSSGYIGTSVQTLMRSKLMGYNIFTGLNRTPLASLGYNDMKLTIDEDVCNAAYYALGGKNGAVLVYNYKTGEIVCKVSAPSYDPGWVPDDLLENEYYDGVFVDNTISSSYTPGSIFKIVTAACAMTNLSDWETRTYNCEQSIDFEGGTVTCLGHHGEINMREAMMYSCNVYFAKLAVDLGYSKLMKTAEDLGFNRSFRFSNFTTVDSEIDLDKSTREVDVAWAGVGQYTVLANPMHFMCLMGAIANDGVFKEPYTSNDKLFGFAGNSERLMSSAMANNLKSLLRDDVAYYYGDYMFPEGWEVCAKTGTAEVGEGKEPNAWIVGFASNPGYPYAFAVCVENGGSGYDVAGSVASSVLYALSTD